MSSSDYQGPDLASILKTLAGLAPQNNQPSQIAQPIQIVQAVPQQIPPPAEQQAFQQTWQHNLENVVQQPKPSAPINAQPKIVDPATIIEWSAGLRCVMKTVARHDNVINDIRRMIKVQHEHEEQWWQGRKALIEKQKAREEGQKKLDEVLKAVGGAISSAPTNNSPEELARELQTFDMKVHRAQMQMVKEMTSKLRGFGVPFFGTKPELISQLGKEGTPGGEGPKDKDEKGMIDEVELVKLQKRMLEILEDICGD